MACGQLRRAGADDSALARVKSAANDALERGSDATYPIEQERPLILAPPWYDGVKDAYYRLPPSELRNRTPCRAFRETWFGQEYRSSISSGPTAKVFLAQIRPWRTRHRCIFPRIASPSSSISRRSGPGIEHKPIARQRDTVEFKRSQSGQFATITSDVWRYLAARISMPITGATATAMQAAWRVGSTLFIIDGLDEVRPATNLMPPPVEDRSLASFLRSASQSARASY